jgi:hypothetical protein
MTAIGKALVFLTLVLGVGAAVFGTVVYTQRPGWFDDVPDGPVAKGHVVVSFKQLAKDADTQGKAAAATSAAWGKQLKELTAAEADQKTRAALYAKLTTNARTGAVGFYELYEDPATGRLDLSKLEPPTPVRGPDGKSLAGADTLLSQIAASTDRIANVLTPSIAKLRAEQKRLQVEVDDTADKLGRQRVIRENLQNESSYLAAAGVNVTEQRETARRRKDQLVRRLQLFR